MNKKSTTRYKVGTIWSTSKGKIKILDYQPKYKSSDGKTHHARATIQFLETGCVRNVQATNIMTGKIEDYRAKTVYGVGYIGSEIKIPERKSKSVIRRIYDLWANMLKRCYGGYAGNESYKDCSVDVRWHSFTNFLNSIQQVEGYEYWEQHPNERICLDKDNKIKGSKVYSLDTCRFLTNEENVREGSFRRWGRSYEPSLIQNG